MKNTKGFTLIELAVVLAIIAVLAAILTPIAIGYIDQARVARAMADAKTIAQSMQLYRRDTGYYPIYNSLAHAQTAAADYTVLISAGTGLTSTTATGIGWAAILGGTSGQITTLLNTNSLGLTTNVENPGKLSYRGPYIGALDTDPWGNSYVVTATNLNSATNRAFVLSAGPDGILQTNVQQGTSAFATLGDDIGVPIN